MAYTKHPNIKDKHWAICTFKENISGKKHTVVCSPYHVEAIQTSMNFNPKATLTEVTGLDQVPLYPGGSYRIDGSKYIQYHVLDRKLLIATEHIPKLLFLHANELVNVGSIYSGLPTAHYCLVLPDNLMNQLYQHLKEHENEGIQARKILSQQLNVLGNQL